MPDTTFAAELDAAGKAGAVVDRPARTSITHQTVAVRGDSLAAGAGGVRASVPSVLSERIGVPVLNLGIGGQTSLQIRARMIGGTITFAGDTINNYPASTVVTGISVPLLSTAADNATRGMAITVAGISGVLTRTATGGPPSTAETHAFIPYALKTGAVASPPNAPFVPVANYLRLPTIIWSGRNNYSDAAQVKADIAAMVAAMEAVGNTSYLVMSIINGDYATEYKGQPGYNSIIALNNDLAATHGDRFFDVRAALVAAYNPNIAQDVIDFGRDIPPSSLRSDLLHLNEDGYTLVGNILPLDFLARPIAPSAYDAAVSTSFRRGMTIGSGPVRPDFAVSPNRVQIYNSGIQISAGYGLWGTDFSNVNRVRMVYASGGDVFIGGDFTNTVSIGTGGTGGTSAQVSLNNGDFVMKRSATIGAATPLPNTSTGHVAIANSAAPAGNPTGGGILFVEAGALKYRGANGTVTTVGPA